MGQQKILIAEMGQFSFELEVTEWQSLSLKEEELCLDWAADYVPDLILDLEAVKDTKHFTDYDDVLRLCANTWLSSGSKDLLVFFLHLIYSELCLGQNWQDILISWWRVNWKWYSCYAYETLRWKYCPSQPL